MYLRPKVTAVVKGPGQAAFQIEAVVKGYRRHDLFRTVTISWPDPFPCPTRVV